MPSLPWQAGYRDLFGQASDGKLVRREFDRIAIRKCMETEVLPGLGPGLRVLDAGSGSLAEQQFREEILATGASLTTCDVMANPGVDVAANLHELPFPDASFDRLICIQVLEHIRHPPAVLAEFFRVLKPGGLLVLTAPQISHILSASQPPHYFNFTCHGLQALAEDAGFAGCRSLPQGGHFFVVGQMLHYLVPVLREAPLPGALKAVLLPMARLLFGALTKTACLYLDRLDRSHRSTLGWCLLAVKPAAGMGA